MGSEHAEGGSLYWPSKRQPFTASRGATAPKTCCRGLVEILSPPDHSSALRLCARWPVRFRSLRTPAQNAAAGTCRKCAPAPAQECHYRYLLSKGGLVNLLIRSRCALRGKCQERRI